MQEVTAESLAAPDAHELHHQLRTLGPVVWLDAIDGWFVTDRTNALTVLRDAESFTVDDERFSTGQVVGASMLTSDGEPHARQRKPFADAFRSSAVQGWGPQVQSTARAIVADLAPRYEAELRTELAAPLAVEVIADALGLVDTEPDELLTWYRPIVRGVNAVSTGDRVPKPALDAVNALAKRVKRTSATPNTLLGSMTNTLSGDELVSNTAVTLFGAIETSEAMTANALLYVLSAPELRDRLAVERDLVAQAIEESLRLEPGAAVVDRYATRRANLAGAKIARGDLVRVSLAAANRDPQSFEAPDEFRLDRTNSRQHLAFVQGPHVCLGMHLARAQTRAAIDAVLDLLPGARLVDVAAPAGMIFRKPERLVAAW